MTMQKTEKITFVGADGESRLAARLDLPRGTPRAYALSKARHRLRIQLRNALMSSKRVECRL